MMHFDAAELMHFFLLIDLRQQHNMDVGMEKLRSLENEMESSLGVFFCGCLVVDDGAMCNILYYVHNPQRRRRRRGDFE